MFNRMAKWNGAERRNTKRTALEQKRLSLFSVLDKAAATMRDLKNKAEATQQSCADSVQDLNRAVGEFNEELEKSKAEQPVQAQVISLTR